MGTVRWAASRMTPGDFKERANCPLVFLILNISLYRQKLSMGCRKPKATQGNEPFSTAERSERVENFLFHATRKYTEAGIEQATVAMRCHGANSPEPHRHVVPESDTSALRAADQQLHKHTSLASWAHHGSFVQAKRYCAVQLAHPPHPLSPILGPRSLSCVSHFLVFALHLYVLYVQSHHFPWLQPHALQSIRFSRISAIRIHIIRWHMCPWRWLLPCYNTRFFLQRGCCCQGKEVVPVDHIRGKGLSSCLTFGSKIGFTAGFEPCPQEPAPSSLAAAHSPFQCLPCLVHSIPVLAASHSSSA